MGLPEIRISFQRKAETLIKRSSRGMVLLLMQDTTKTQIITPYRQQADVVQEDWTERNLKYLQLAFAGSPQGVIAVRAAEGESGAVDMAETIKLIEQLNYDWMAYPACTEANSVELVTYIREARAIGRKVKAVLPGVEADCEGVVNFTSASISVVWDSGGKVEEYTTAEYTARIAGLLAGLPLTQSSTYKVLEEIVDVEQLVDTDAEINKGRLVIIYDGEKFKIGRGVTSLTKTGEYQPEDFKKIKIVEGMDLIRTDIYTTFEDEFVGKVNNTYDNKQDFVGAVNRYFVSLMGSVLDASGDNYVEVDADQNAAYLRGQGKDIDGLTEQQLKEANTGAHLFLRGKITMLDAMEDLNLVLNM